ncbi:MAG: aminoglycoside phosphotransferase family protein [Elusimicrobia bacterium]|nr:aminoglycoside phosphotransferase family protein [Elusimicrobiota bacterium]
MLIGIDLDNTIVSYDEVFHQAALEKGLIPAGLPRAKGSVRDCLRGKGQEEEWTALQGYVYGPRMSGARPFPGALEFLAECRWRGIPVRVISHRTLQPFRGPDYDLHQAAYRWMEEQGFFDPLRIGLSREHVHLELTKREKCERIAQMGCSHFVDDLPEFLADPSFPEGLERFLFDPGGSAAVLEGAQGPPLDPRVRRVASWAELAGILLPQPADPSPSVDEASLIRSVDRMLPVLGMGRARGLHRVPGAANNQAFRVETSRGSVFLKKYFFDPADPRDRLRAEFGFSRFAWSCGLRCLPMPLDCDTSQRLGLYEFIEGERVEAGRVTERMVSEALDFFLELNRHRSSPQALVLSEASEACLSIDDHLTCVDRRLGRLLSVKEASDLDRRALEWVRRELLPAWQKAAESIRSRARVSCGNLGERVADSQRALSPSDFGFHNALLAEDGRLRFIDFEYAGWDDPAKTICDFFCQPAVPVPWEHLGSSLGRMWETFPMAEGIRRRVALVLPAHLAKWCCILLNDFLPVGSRRRVFAGQAEDELSRKECQLGKAQAALKRLRDQIESA